MFDMKSSRKISKTGDPVGAAHILSPDERTAAGKDLRAKVPRELHGGWKEFNGRPDPIDILYKSGVGQLKELLAIRYGRMLQSPFALCRGSTGLMASDLSRMPPSGRQ
jgi:hypothetical protein